MDAYKLKWLAIIGMILNHMVIAWWEIIPVWLAIPLYMAGGLTFPIMAFFVVEGYRHTSNLKRYVLRLFIFGAIGAVFHPLVFGMIGMNILFTIIVGIFALILNDKMRIRPLFWVIFVVLCLLTAFPLPFDWGIIGIVMILLTHKIRNESRRRMLPAIIGGAFALLGSLLGIASFYLLKYTPGMEEEFAALLEGGIDLGFLIVSIPFFIGCIVAAFLLKNFNGERGRQMKWLFYIIYPVHLAVIGLIALALGLVDLSVFGF